MKARHTRRVRRRRDPMLASSRAAASVAVRLGVRAEARRVIEVSATRRSFAPPSRARGGQQSSRVPMGEGRHQAGVPGQV